MLLQAAATSTRLRAARMQGARPCRAPDAGRRIATRSRNRCSALSSILRDLGVLSSSADERSLANADLKSAPSALLRSYDRDRVAERLFGGRPGPDALDRNASPKIVADWLALQITEPSHRREYHMRPMTVAPSVRQRQVLSGRPHVFLPDSRACPDDSSPAENRRPRPLSHPPRSRRPAYRPNGRGPRGRHRHPPIPCSLARRPPIEAGQVVRRATREDVITRLKQQQREQEAHRICLLKIKERGLAMKLARVEQLFDGSRLIFYYTAEGRVDFRELVRDLAAHFRARIEMRQIGVRDEARMLGGYGSCGRPLCCTTWLQIVRAGVDQDGQAAEPEPESVEALGHVRPVEVLPALRASERQGREARRLRRRRGGCGNPTGCGTARAGGGCGSGRRLRDRAADG